MPAIFLVLILVVSLLSACHAPEEKSSKNESAPVLAKSERLSQQRVVSSFSLTGVMDSRKSVSIFPRVEGYISKIVVSPGQSVVSGQVLIEMDRSKEEATLAAKESNVQLAEADYDKEQGSLKSLEAELVAKESEVKFQKIEYERFYWLEKRGVVPTESVDKEQRDLEVVQSRRSSMDAQIAAQKNVITRAKRRIDEAMAEMRAEKEQLRYYSLKSPFAGVVGNIPVKVGDFVNQQTKLARVSESQPLEVNVQVPKDEAASLHKGTPLELLNDDGSVCAKSEIFYVSPTVDLQSQSVLVKGLCENQKHELRPDQSVLVKVLLSSAPGITVPTEAITFVAGQAFVYVVSHDKDGKLIASQRPITITDIRDNRATISAGLKSADEIVVSGIQMLADGSQIELQGAAVFTDFFIKRPVFATVISIIIILAGGISIPSLPISQYPAVAPPQIQVSANYIGASAEQVESSVTSTLERELNGVEGLKYISSSSGNDGSSKITATFNMERGSDQAALDVQTKISSAQGRLPEEVKRLGVSVEKVSTSVVMTLALFSPEGKYSQEYLSNYADIYLKDVFKGINGVGMVSLVGERKYAMRIWLNPSKLSQFKMTPLDVVSALQAQNRQVGAGDLGSSPAPAGQKYQYNLKVIGRMSDPKEFGRTVVRRSDNGALVHLDDIGRVELGAENYQTDCIYMGKGAVAMVIYLRSGGNALKVSDGIKKELSRLEKGFPPGIKCAISLDTTEAVKESIHEVIQTLYEAIFLVVLVIFFFLQDWRSMLIACVTIPVSLIGTFIFMKLVGFSINTLTLFGLTLATGLVVDDAIVVVENVKRLMEESHLSALDATTLAMKETAGALIATALVLAAVFIPVAFFPGTTGQLYKQFALTIAVSVVLSAFNALTLSPALAALLLKPEGEHQPWFFRLINKLIDGTRKLYEVSLRLALKLTPLVIVGMLASLFMVYWLYKVLPTGFVPDEDQGYFYTVIRGPDGTSLQYTKDVVEKVCKSVEQEKEAEPALGLSGFGFAGISSNFGLVFCPLKHWKEREGKKSELEAVMDRVQAAADKITEASVAPFNPPALEGMGQVGGFSYQMQDIFGRSTAELSAAANKLIDAGNAERCLKGLFTNFTAGTPRLQIDVRRDLAELLNVDIAQVLDTLQILLGSSYVNDFDYLNRSYRVYVQADKAFRTEPKSLFEYYVRSRDDKMVGIENLLKLTPSLSAPIITHYNLFRSVEINGNAAAGFSSGQAIEMMQKLSKKILPQGMTFSWSGISLEEIEAGSSAVVIFALGLVFVYLVLAAQYESYTDPVIILFSVPPAVLGALSGQWLRGLQNDVFCQIGLVMLVGLASKNAILIVEFANHLLHSEKLSFSEAAVKASTMRLRPILMTSLAFVVGLLPLVLAHGAGAHSRQSLGTAVCGGMVVSTIVSLYLVPVMFVLIKSFLALLKGKKT